MSDAKDRTLSLERTFDAPIELVWEAWTNSEHIAKWWGPQGMETRVLAHDFKVGGAWKYAMTMPNSNEFIADGVYKAITELKHIISSANFKPMTEGVEIQAYFESAGDKTKFKFSVVHPTAEYCQQQEQMGFMNGWGSVFDRLSTFVSA
ncbi:SRPBCC family protein [Roseivirga sp.]|uniref:SRPBCC family protein n=1 Tax=Roseivirga sp. TaxID=1964215 RepID=UPI003B8B07B5